MLDNKNKLCKNKQTRNNQTSSIKGDLFNIGHCKMLNLQIR